MVKPTTYGSISENDGDVNDIEKLLHVDDWSKLDVTSQSTPSTAHSTGHDDTNDYPYHHQVTLDAPVSATIPSEVANMTKNLIGGGVLSLSGGIALFANHPSAAIFAIYWVVLLGAVFGYFCLL